MLTTLMHLCYFTDILLNIVRHDCGHRIGCYKHHALPKASGNIKEIMVTTELKLTSHIFILFFFLSLRVFVSDICVPFSFFPIITKLFDLIFVLFDLKKKIKLM